MSKKPPVPRIVLQTDSDVLRFAKEILPRAGRRETWLVFLDRERVVLPIMMPIEDLPSDPHEFVELPTGAEMFPTTLARVAEGVAELADAEAAVIIWERCDDDKLSQLEIDSVLALDESFALVGVPIVAQLLCHSDGIRLIEPYELEPDAVLEALQAYQA